MDDIPPSYASKLTIETRDQVVLIAINRPYIHNRIDPETFYGSAKAYYDYDPSLRAAVLFGHGPNFSQGRPPNLHIDGDHYFYWCRLLCSSVTAPTE